MTADVTAFEVTKSYGETPALRGVTFAAGAGEIFAVVGPDGAGKTTLLRILAGLLERDGGRLDVLGADPDDARQRQKRLVGYVPQEFSMFPSLSVAENLEFVATCHRIPPREARARRDALLATAGLTEFLDRRAGALSGGMKQKLALCGALLPRPRLLLLDEPTTGVDVVARADFWAALGGVADDALVIVATNYLEEAERADRMLYLREGRALTIGTPDEVRRQAPVNVFQIAVPAGAEAGLGARLRAAALFDRVEPHRGLLRVETRLAHAEVDGWLRSTPATAELRLADVEVDLETALLALERHGARGEARQ